MGSTEVGPAPPNWLHATRRAHLGLGAVRDDDEASTNWSGQIADADGSAFTAAQADWTVPAVQPSGGDEYSATWVGVDGTAPGPLIQVGTAQDSGGGATNYFAWFEIVPGPAEEIQDATVVPGDEIEAYVDQQSPGSWVVFLWDITQRWYFDSGPMAYSGPGATAEWIEEAPTVNGSQSNLADFGSVQFNDIGVSPPGSYPVDSVSMVDAAGSVIAVPGSIDAASFPISFEPPPPIVDTVSPAQGATAGGTSVVITGDYLAGASSVWFGGVAASFQQNSDDSITATAPPQAAGTVNITVGAAGGVSSVDGADQFTYVAPGPSAGYDLVGRDGGVFVFGSGSGFYGSLPGIHVHVSNIVGMVATADDHGYFLVGSDGGVFAFGDAPFLGSLPGLHVHVSDIVGIVPTADDHGYFLVGSDGGVFAFGDAPFLGSLPGRGIHVDDIIGIAADATDTGYWLIAATGQVYAFGDAANFGSYLGSRSPLSAIAATPDGGGYWLVSQNGSVYSFGDARFSGSLPGIHVTPTHPVIGIVPTGGGGYWLVGSDGGIFAFGDAPFVGSLPGLHVVVTDIVGAVPTTP